MMTESARLKEKNNNDEDDGEKIGDNVKKVGGEVAEGILDKSKEDDDDEDKGRQKCCSNRKNVDNRIWY